MDLVPIGDGQHASDTAARSTVPGLAVVSIASDARQRMGLKLGVVETRPLAREVRTSARIAADETRLWRVTTKIDGWVDKLFVAYTGQAVKKGDPLLTVYSPDLVSAQSEYLTALRASDSFKPGRDTNGPGSLVASARRRLELWDISADQIEHLARTGEVEKHLTLYAPAGGVVTDRTVLAGQKIMPGEPLMVIADLAVVWGDADIYQSDLPYVKVGMPLEISLPFWPGKIFNGKVMFVSPTLDGASRTLRARLEIPNSESLLKPGMFGDARLHYELGETLSIPASAVMFGGQRTYAFRDIGDGHLAPTDIQIGARSDGYYELLAGLNEGDKVAVSANFLVDSESNLKAALEALSGGTPPVDVLEEIPRGEFEKLLGAYLNIQAALAADDFAKARDTARTLANLKLNSAGKMASASDLDEAREHFRAFSATVVAAAQKSGAPAGQRLYRLYCSMAFDNQGGDWLQTQKETFNPYFGPSMLKCGEVKEEITVAQKVAPASGPREHAH